MAEAISNQNYRWPAFCSDGLSYHELLVRQLKKVITLERKIPSQGIFLRPKSNRYVHWFKDNLWTLPHHAVLGYRQRLLWLILIIN
jgi:hypothetical protein